MAYALFAASSRCRTIPQSRKAIATHDESLGLRPLSGVAPSPKAERLLRHEAAGGVAVAVGESHHPPKPKGYCDSLVLTVSQNSALSRTIPQSRKAIATEPLARKAARPSCRTIPQSRKAIATVVFHAVLLVCAGVAPSPKAERLLRRPVPFRCVGLMDFKSHHPPKPKGYCDSSESAQVSHQSRSRTIPQSRKAIATDSPL